MSSDSNSPLFWCDGVAQILDQSTLPLHHPAVLYGESAFETFRVIDETPLYLTAHLKRLYETVAGLGLGDLPRFCDVEGEVRQALGTLPKVDHGWRIRMTLVSDRVSLMGLNGGDAPIQRWLMAVPLPDPVELSQPLRVCFSTYRKIPPSSLSPALKHGNYLSSLLSLREAQKNGYDDAILLTESGVVTEATASNLYWIKNGQLLTCASELVFPGLTRRRVQEYARENGMTVAEGYFSPEDLLNADEVFVTSSIRGVVPLVAVEQTPFDGGDQDSITRKIASGLRDMDLQEMARRGEAS